MTPREIFWANFRVARQHVSDMTVAERRRAYTLMRIGPIGVAMSVAAYAAMGMPVPDR